jgi:outer membrane protein assembly factor BamB
MGKRDTMRSLIIFALLALTFGVAGAADWPVFGHDAGRSGVGGDQTLTRSNVAQLRVRWHVMLDAVADSAPIVVGDRLFLTDRNGTTYAIDAASGHILWRFATKGPKITTSVPAYDAAGHVLYAPGVDGAIHKLDPATGRELHDQGFPVTITLAPQTEKDASSLNLANGYLYAQTSGYLGDATPYVGHVVAIRLRDGNAHVFNSLCSARHTLIQPQSCDAQRSGMWSRAGVVVDPDPAMNGRVYVATGNGPFDAAGGNFGDSILSLSADASGLLGSLTPSNYDELEVRDLDVGSSSPALLPRQPASSTPLLAVQGGKDGILRLFDRAHLPGLGPSLQTISLGARLFSAPAVWTDSGGTTWIYIGLGDGLHAYRLITRNRASNLTSAWFTSLASGNEGPSPVLSGGIVFVALTGGQLVALDAQTGRRLWVSTALGLIHWESPVVADGTVYCSDQSGALTAFALAAHPR